MKEKNVIFLSMKRCGVSWVGDTIKLVYRNLYGKELKIHYENDRDLISRNLVKGWNGAYNLDPKILLNLGYDKIIIIKRSLEIMKEVHAHYHGYKEIYGTLEKMKEKRPAFFEVIELYYKLIYEQNIDDPRILIVDLEDLNIYTHSSFQEIIEFLDFRLSFIQKIKFFFRLMRNKIKTFIIPVNPERNWNIYSALLPKNHELCRRLEYLKKLDNKNKIENKIQIEVKSCQTY